MLCKLSSEMCQMVLQMLSHLYKILFNGSQNSLKKLGAGDPNDKITLMEDKIAALESQNKELQRQLEYNRNKEAALQKVLCNYDNLLKKVLMEKNARAQEDETTVHLANLEFAFYDLLQKYEKAKLVVQGFQQNENVLKSQLLEYENILDNFRTKFSTYKSHSDNRLEAKCAKGKKRRLLATI